MSRRILVFVLFSLLPSLAFGETAFALRNVLPGEKVPDLALYELDGVKEGKLSGMTGTKGALVVWFATWSPRSMELLAFLRSRAGEWEKDGLAVLAVNAEKETLSGSELAAVKESAAAVGLPFPVLIDRGLVGYGALGVISTPTTLFVRKDLTLAEVYPGFPSEARTDLPDRVAAFLGKVPIAPKGPVVVERVPRNNALLYYNLGKRLFQLARSGRTGKLGGVPDGAVSKLDEAVARDPAYVRPKVLKAIVYHLAGKGEVRDQLLAAIAKEGSTDPGDRRFLALAYVYVGQDGRGEELLPALEKGLPGDPALPLARGVIAAGRKDESGVAAALKALSADPRAKELLGEAPSVLFAPGEGREGRLGKTLERVMGFALEEKVPAPAVSAPAPPK